MVSVTSCGLTLFCRAAKEAGVQVFSKIRVKGATVIPEGGLDLLLAGHTVLLPHLTGCAYFNPGLESLSLPIQISVLPPHTHPLPCHQSTTMAGQAGINVLWHLWRSLKAT